jgi:hypothetical protein
VTWTHQNLNTNQPLYHTADKLTVTKLQLCGILLYLPCAKPHQLRTTEKLLHRKFSVNKLFILDCPKFWKKQETTTRRNMSTVANTVANTASIGSFVLLLCVCSEVLEAAEA